MDIDDLIISENELAPDLVKTILNSGYDLESVRNAYLPEEWLNINEDPDEILAIEEEVTDLRALIRDMTMAQKIKLAAFGNGTARFILIHDASRLIQDSVLSNAKLTDREVAELARNSNVDDNVLRKIGSNRKWIKNYSVKAGLVFNPKTPTGVGLRFVKFLNRSDLRRLAKSKNIPQTIATAAKKLVDKVK